MEIERLTKNPDIIAVATRADDTAIPIVWRDGLPMSSWELVMSSALTMYQRVRETVGHDGGYIRVIVGMYTVLVQREYGTSYAVVIKTGHDVAKSLHRTIRRCAKPPRGAGPVKVAKPASGEQRRIAVDAARAITADPEDDGLAESIDDMAIMERPL